MKNRRDKFKVILLAGRKQSGKNTFAERITQHGFVEASYADRLKRMAVDILSFMGCDVQLEYFNDGVKKEQFITDTDGQMFLFNNNTEKKMPLTYRQFIQKLGTESLRDVIDNDIWIYPVVDVIKKTYVAGVFNGVVVTDCRFPNEISKIYNLLAGFEDIEVLDVLIIRPGQKASDMHASETSLDNYDFTLAVSNNGSIEDLWLKADHIVSGQWKLNVKSNR